MMLRHMNLNNYADRIEKATLGNIEDLHWNEENQMYCDVNVNDDGKRLRRGPAQYSELTAR